MSERSDRDNGGRQAAVGPAGAMPLHQPTGAGPGVGKLTRVQAEMCTPRAKASSIAPVPMAEPSQAEPPSHRQTPTTSLSLGPDNEGSAHAGHASAAQQGVSPQLASSAQNQSTQTQATQAMLPGQPSPPKLTFEREYEDQKTKLKLRAKFIPRDGITSRGTQKAAGKVGPVPVEGKLKEEELKLVLGQKGVRLQESLASAEVGVTVFEGMKISIKLAAFEVTVPLDYSLLKLTIEGAAMDVPWFANTSWVGDFRVDVVLSWSKAIDQNLLLKIMAELAPLEKAAEKVAAITAEVEETRRKLEAAKKAHLAAEAENKLARKAEGTAARAKKVALNAERAAAKAERVAVTAEARAAAQAEGKAARAAFATAKADVKAAQIASNATTKLMVVEKAAIRQQQRALKALLPRLKSATSAMKTAAGGIKNLLAKQIGARIGKVLATSAGQALLKAIPVVGWLLLANDVYNVVSWLVKLEWAGGYHHGTDGAGAGDAHGGGTPSAAPADANSADAGVQRDAADEGGADADGGEVDRGVAGEGTSGVGSKGAAKTPSSTATGAPTPVTTPAPTAAAKPALTAAPAPTTQQSTASTTSGVDRVTQNDGPGRQGNGGSGGGSATATAEPQQPTTVPATGSSVPSGDIATIETLDLSSKSADGSRTKGDSADHDGKDVADHEPVSDGAATAAPEPAQAAPAPT
ncbi:MAG: hypothetical protein KBG15_22190, partial [Kofleriaceae bacterium]|nr:hypothetical protein [Kofleriaceae bacterium]